jgi:hypothetical protein
MAVPEFEGSQLAGAVPGDRNSYPARVRATRLKTTAQTGAFSDFLARITGTARWGRTGPR